MTVEELCRSLAAASVKERAFDFEGSDTDEVYCLDKVAGGWAVYYRERGLHRDEQLFSTEDEACRQIRDQILLDPTTRM